METCEHVLLCQAAGAPAVWKTNILKVEEVLVKENTHPAIQTAIIQGLIRWQAQLPYTPATRYSDVQNAAQDQNTIGWRNLLTGWMSKKWQVLQQRHYDRLYKQQYNWRRQTGRSWARKLLKALYKLGREQWEHRNKVVHDPAFARPHHQSAVQVLRAEIIMECTKGPRDLPTIDRHHFALPTARLLQSSLSYLKAWILNVTADRDRQLRRVTNDIRQHTRTPTRDKVIQWIRTGRMS